MESKGKIFLIMALAVAIVLVSGCINGDDDKATACEDECNSEGSGQCIDAAFYTCSNTDEDGCLEKELLDYCGLDYVCVSPIRCESPTYDPIFEIRSIDSIERVTNKFVEKGMTYETIMTIEDISKTVSCKIIHVYETQATISCEEIVAK